MRRVLLTTLLLLSAYTASGELALLHDTTAQVTTTSDTVGDHSTTQPYHLSTRTIANDGDSARNEEGHSSDGFKIGKGSEIERLSLGNAKVSTHKEEEISHDGSKISPEQRVPGNNNLKAITEEESSRMMKEDEDNESHVPSDHSLVGDTAEISQVEEQTESDTKHNLEEVNMKEKFVPDRSGHNLEKVNLTRDSEAIPSGRSIAPVSANESDNKVPVSHSPEEVNLKNETVSDRKLPRSHDDEEVIHTQDSTVIPGAQSRSIAPGGAKVRCPAGCMCSEAAELQVQCSVGDSLVTVEQTGDKYSVECQLQSSDMMLYEDMPTNYTDLIQQESSPNLSCSDLPSLSLPHSDSAVSLSISQCPLSWQCVQSAIGLARVKMLSLTDGSWPTFGTPQEIQELSVIHHYPVNLTLPVESLSALPLLHSLTVRGVSLSLSGALPALSLSRLELAQCGLNTLPARLFIHLKGLQHLYLHGNRLETVNDDALQGLTSLTTLGLSSNRLTSLPTAGLAAHCPNLRVLSAFNNEIATLGDMTNLTQLTELELFYNRVPLTLSPAALSNLRQLKAVDLRDCGLKALPAALLTGSYSLQRLNLANNDIQDIPQEFLHDQVELSTLDLSHNALEALRPAVFGAQRALQRLLLDGNRLTNVDSALSVPLPALISLSLSHNRLAAISRPALAQCPALQDLSLAHNNITSYWIYPGIMDNMDYLLNTVRLLRSLDMSYNALSLAPSASSVPLSLAHLDLSHNDITNVTDLNYLTDNITVNLTYNKITTVYMSSATVRAQNDNPRNVVLLDNNPFTCDCFMYNVIRRVHGFIHPDIDKVTLQFGDAKCMQPVGLNGTEIVKVREEDLYCQTDSSECVDSCQCNVTPYKNALEVICQNIPDILPSEEHFGVTSTELTLLKPPVNFNNDTQVQVLNLSGLALTEVPLGEPSKALQLLDLSNNSLTQVPVQLLSNNLTVKLSLNPFQCDCWNQHDVSLLQYYSESVSDYDNLTCVNGDLIRAVSVKQLCVKHYAAAIGGSLLVIGVIIAFAALLFVYYRIEVEILLTRYGVIKRREELDDKQYDAFISYAFEDEQFVLEKLIPKLEIEEGLTLCVHSRDWLPGEWIAAAIATSVNDSRRTVVLLSNNFINSRWARLEIQTAIASAHDNTTKLIVILLDDVTKHPDLDPELKAYLRTNTYVQWGDPWFWRKLLHALPKRRDAIRPPARSVCPKDNRAMCPIPSDVLMTKISNSDVHPADVIMEANKGKNIISNGIDNVSNGINNMSNAKSNNQDGKGVIPNGMNNLTNNQSNIPDGKGITPKGINTVSNIPHGINEKSNVLNGVRLGSINTAFKQDELCDKLNSKLPALAAPHPPHPPHPPHTPWGRGL